MTNSKHKKASSRWLILFMILCSVFLAGFGSAASSIRIAKYIPIQSSGRIKPLDAFSRNAIKLITGKETWVKKPAYLVVLDLLAERDKIAGTKFIRIDYLELKEKLGLPRDQNYFSVEELAPYFDRIKSWVKSSQDKRDQDLRPTKLEQKAEELSSKINMVAVLSSGESLTVVPAPFSPVWGSPYEAQIGFSSDFLKLIEFYKNGDGQSFEKAVVEWTEKVYAIAKEVPRWKLTWEVRYYDLRPFEWAAVAYFAAFLLLVFCKKNRLLSNIGFASLLLAIFYHTLGIVSRVLILSRPPVSNMYESMIFMNWALIVFALGFSIVKRSSIALAVGSLVSGLIMIYGNLLPLDTSLEVLVPVLRSNYWLTIHVMTIVSSYGAFGLAMGLGHRHLFNHAFGKFSRSAEEESGNLIFKVIQLGTLLVGIGTVLGGVWANESWGRFWGWDPKETWALITFLGYVVVVHLKYAKKLSDFALALCSVLGFLLVLMTWYGVNFVLGRGLHSYGQGAGGMNWVIYYLIFEAVFVGFILLRSNLKLKT